MWLTLFFVKSKKILADSLTKGLARKIDQDISRGTGLKLICILEMGLKLII